MAIQEPGAPVPTVKSPITTVADEIVGGSDGIREVPIPQFDRVDPTKPGMMSSAHISAESIHPQPHATKETDMNQSSSDNGSSINQALFTRGQPASSTQNPSFETTPENTMNTETSNTASEASAAQEAKKAVKSAKASAKKKSTILKGFELAGGLLGGGAVFGACGLGIKAAKAAEAAAAATVAGEAATAATVAAETVAVAETVVVAEAAAATGIFGSITGALTAEATLAGLTLPVWGWAAAAVAVGAVGYGVYKLVKKDDAEASQPAEQTAKKPETEGVTVGEAVRAVGKGAMTGAVAAGVMASSVLLVGQVGVAVLAKSTAVFGVKYGPIVAIGGTFVAVNMSFNLAHKAGVHYAAYRAEKNDDIAATKAAQAAPAAAAA